MEQTEGGRTLRIRSLGDELLRVMQSMNGGADALLFFSRLERCECYTADELARAGVAEIVGKGREFADHYGDVLGQAGTSCLDVECLLVRAYGVAAGDVDGAVPVAMDALELATVADWLPPSIRTTVLGACEHLVSLIEAFPAQFETVESLAIDRALYERPSKLPQPARDLIASMREVSTLAGIDEDSDAT